MVFVAPGRLHTLHNPPGCPLRTLVTQRHQLVMNHIAPDLALRAVHPPLNTIDERIRHRFPGLNRRNRHVQPGLSRFHITAHRVVIHTTQLPS